MSLLDYEQNFADVLSKLKEGLASFPPPYIVAPSRLPAVVAVQPGFLGAALAPPPRPKFDPGHYVLHSPAPPFHPRWSTGVLGRGTKLGRRGAGSPEAIEVPLADLRPRKCSLFFPHFPSTRAIQFFVIVLPVPSPPLPGDVFSMFDPFGGLRVEASS